MRYVCVLSAAVLAVFLGGSGKLRAVPPQPQSVPAASTERALLDKYCVTCHNEKTRTAGLLLDKLDVERVPDGAETWEKVIRKLRGGMMPPQGMPRPDETAKYAFINYLETSLDRAALAHPNPGRAPLHRLNRTEYGNAIRDLLSVETDVTALLPADDESDAIYSGSNYVNLTSSIV